MRPMVVTIDALDGVGKSELVANLAAELGWVPMATPGDGLAPLRRAIVSDLAPSQEARALFYAATVAARTHEARQYVDAGRGVILDRGWLSTLAYALARGADPALSTVAGTLPRPDLSIVLHLDEAERQRRLSCRGALTAADHETLDPGFRETVMHAMTGEQARAFAPLVVVDVTGADRAEMVRRVAEPIALVGQGDGPLGQAPPGVEPSQGGDAPASRREQA